MPLSADEIRQSFFGEHGIAAVNTCSASFFRKTVTHISTI